MKWLLENTLLRFGLEPAVPAARRRRRCIVVGAFSALSADEQGLPAGVSRKRPRSIAATAAPGTSLEEMNRISDVIEQQILSVPEVRKVGRRLGRAERGDHVVPVSTAEFDVDFREDEGATERQGAQPRRKFSTTSTSACRPCPASSRGRRSARRSHRPHAQRRLRAGGDQDLRPGPRHAARSSASRCRRSRRPSPASRTRSSTSSRRIPQLRIEADRDARRRLRHRARALQRTTLRARRRQGSRRTARRPARGRTSSCGCRSSGATRRRRSRSCPSRPTSGQRIPLSLVADVREAKGPERHLPREQPAPLHHRDQADRARRRRARRSGCRRKCAKK